MLTEAAIEAVNRWKYQPFEVDGKAAKAITVVAVPFGNVASHAAEDRAEMDFQYDFWTAEDSVEVAMARGDYAGAGQQLNRFKDTLSTDSKSTWHLVEQWQWMTTMGQLYMSQQKYGEAEPYFKKALAVLQEKTQDKDSPEIGASLANLARLYASEKRSDLARDHAARSLFIFEKSFKNIGSRDPSAQQTYGRAIAQQSWMLLKLAKERTDAEDTNSQCRILLQFQSFLSTSERESAVSDCQLESKNPGTKSQ